MSIPETHHIDRKNLVSRHNPTITSIDADSPLSVGNGRIAHTVDITGMQTLAEEYETRGFPLCTMSEWGWHTEPFPGTKTGKPDAGALKLTEYRAKRGTVRYAVKKFPGNEAVYDWYRHNPHRLNLARVALTYRNGPIRSELITPIAQTLRLYEGIIESSFLFHEVPIRVETSCDPESDTIAWTVSAPVLPEGLAVELSFPYGSPGISGSDWARSERHLTDALIESCGKARILRTLDGDRYEASLSSPFCDIARVPGEHRVVVSPRKDAKRMTLSARFSPTGEIRSVKGADGVMRRSCRFWRDFWEKGGAIELSGSADPRALELERRIILSQYLLAIQSAGTVPPAETGLTCNSWYGKFHLEMYPFHAAWLPLWGHTDLLERSLPWFPAHLGVARANAAKNGYAGARWPKMIGPDAIDSPSPIAPLLVWQQPHVIYLLCLAYRTVKTRRFLERYRETIFATAEFMADFVEFDPARGTWNLEGPLIPVQEEHDAERVRNPAFEVEYWRYGLLLAIDWLDRIGERAPNKWSLVAERMAPMPVAGGLYAAHEACADTFGSFNRDHPSMLMSLGFIPGDRVDRDAMRATLDRVIECWDYRTLWGWDFAMMALTASRLGDDSLAIDSLLADTPKNRYEASGNNRQASRADLPLYLPGNGALLVAVAQLASTGAFGHGGWNARFEGIAALP